MPLLKVHVEREPSRKRVINTSSSKPNDKLLERQHKDERVNSEKELSMDQFKDDDRVHYQW